MSARIVLFGPYPPPFGGVAVFVQTLYEFLIKSGVACDLKVYKDEAAKQYVRPTFTSTYFHFSKLRKNDVCADSCSFFIEYPSAGAVTAWLFLKATRRFKWIKIIHDGTLPKRHKTFNLLARFLFKLSILFVDKFVVVQKDLEQWLIDNIKVSQDVFCVPSLLPLQHSNAQLPEHILNAFTGYDKVICSIGVFTPNYGFKHIANAVDVIRQDSCLKIALILIDGSFAKDADYAKAVKGRDWIKVFENISHPHVLAILKKCDVFVRAVALESYGLSRVEAILCGTPVVATRVGETRGMLLFEYGDEVALIKQINEALFNPSVRQDIHFWADQFRNEAEKNMTNLISIINS